MTNGEVGISEERLAEIEAGMREHLADIEHKQWAHWTRYMLERLEPAVIAAENRLTDAEVHSETGQEVERAVQDIARWHRQIETPYGQLTEKEKESDRAWADRVLAIAGVSDLVSEVRRLHGLLDTAVGLIDGFRRDVATSHARTDELEAEVERLSAILAYIRTGELGATYVQLAEEEVSRG